VGPLVVSSTVPLPIAPAWELLTSGMPRWWPYGHRLGEVELCAVQVEAVTGGRWYQRDVLGQERDFGVVVEAEAPYLLRTQSFVGAGYQHDPRGELEISVRLVEHESGTTVTWTLEGFERLGPGGQQLRDDFAGTYGWGDMATALEEAISR
jgi:hypothetical protein